MTVTIYHWLMLVLGVSGFLCTAYVARRAQYWRDTDDAKALMSRVAGIEGRLTALEVETKQLATRADIARIESELKGLERVVINAEQGVGRIESILMRGREVA